MYKSSLLRISRHKLDRILKLVAGQQIEAAIARVVVKMSPNARPVLSLLKNIKAQKPEATIAEAWTTKGSYIKRFKPASFLKQTRKRMPTSRINIITK